MEKPILFHGTDARIVKMSDDEREYMRQCCKTAGDCLWKHYSQMVKTEARKYKDPKCGEIIIFPQIISDYKQQIEALNIDGLYYGLCWDINNYISYDNGSALYQYGNIYLTASELTAKKYAYKSFAFGEFGHMIYTMILALPAMNFADWNPTQKESDAINQIVSFAHGKSEPVVIPVSDYEIENIRSEDGTKKDLDVMLMSHIRYLGKLKLNLEDAEYLKVKKA